MTKKFILNIAGLALLATNLTYASSTTKNDNIDTSMNTKVCITEDCISTKKLQEEVEKLSMEGKLPFEMGLELMKRWSDDQIS